MAEQRRIGYRWHLRTVMASRNLWKTTDLQPLLRSRGINLSDTQVYRLVQAAQEFRAASPSWISPECAIAFWKVSAT